MFVDESLEDVEFLSSWKKEKNVADSEAQTKDLSVREVAVQSVRRKDKELQTEVEEQFGQIRLEDDNPELLKFVNSWEPFITKQLGKNLRSHAFDGYGIQWDEEAEDITLEHTLSHHEYSADLQVTAVSWNSTGAVVGSALGRHDHEDWCTHKSVVCTWNLDRRTVQANKPDVSIEMNGCIMSLSFHPTQPAILAAGTFNGEVVVWDTAKENDMVLATSGIGEASHREPVTDIQWVHNPSVKGFKYSILSVGGDGRVLHWRITSKNTLKILDGFGVLASKLPRSLRARGDQEVGLTCISYSTHEDTTFILGSNAGAIFKCSTTASAVIRVNEPTSVELKDPVTLTFSPHKGPVHSVNLSPYHRHIFVSCGMDSSLRVYSLVQSDPIISIEPGEGYLHGSEWSPSRPLVLCTVTANGTLLIYDLLQNSAVPVAKTQVSSSSLYCVQFNKNQPQLICTGNGAGEIHVYRLTEHLSNQDSRELQKLEEYADTALKN